ncbi:MAG TPA: FAD-dependent oxidoreductase, partial [Pirellula sp.]|nr:FAD-dependent oxidoreductase [Pirellula sp.]
MFRHGDEDDGDDNDHEEPEPSSDEVTAMEFDVVIIGSGPSGMACAHELAKRGLSIAVIEKDSHIGGKPMSFLA